MALLAQPHAKNRKGTVAVHRWVNLQASTAGERGVCEASRRRSRRLARLYEAQRLLLKPDSAGAQRQLSSLLAKLWPRGVPAGFRARCLKLRNEISACLAERTREEAALKDKALRQWRSDMSSGNLKKLKSLAGGSRAVRRTRKVSSLSAKGRLLVPGSRLWSSSEPIGRAFGRSRENGGRTPLLLRRLCLRVSQRARDGKSRGSR